MRQAILFLALLISTLYIKDSSAELLYYGTVSSRESEKIISPCDARIDEIFIKEGEYLHEGSIVGNIETDKVYAIADGVVSGIFAQEGDYSDSVVERYGALLYIEPINRYMLNCSIEKAYSNSENRYIHIGEVVYLSCTKDGSHFGKGIITAIDDEDSKKYSVEIIEGVFYMNETVGVFRDPNYTSLSRIGRGTVDRAPVISVDAEGSVLKYHVQKGDYVHRGQLLIETIPGKLEGLCPIETNITCNVSGIVASVEVSEGAKLERGEALAIVYPTHALQIQMLVSEEDLAEVTVGRSVLIEFNWDVNGTHKYIGNISSVSYLNQSSDENYSGTKYMAYVNFVADESIRVGMTSVVYLK